MQEKPNTTYQQTLLDFEEELTPEALDAILEKIEVMLISIEPVLKIRKRIFCILVEALQNVFNYLRIENVEDKRLRIVTCLLEKSEKGYTIKVGNYLLFSKVEQLREQIERVNRYSKERLRETYLATLAKNELDEQGGAGLGILDLIRKSGQKLRYRFRKINEDISHFLIQITIIAN
ncbi:MAG: DUF6272 family protein [Thermonemataceae bacterium]